MSNQEVKQTNDQEAKQITEADKDLIESWYKERPEDINAFISKLHTDYVHDYGTICHAIAASAIAAAWKCDSGPQGGITGFQAGAVMWEFIRHWQSWEGPLRLLNYENMLDPQCENKFNKVIDSTTWKWIQDKARESLASSEHAHPNVKAHWESIITGVVPFGYIISDTDD